MPAWFSLNDLYYLLPELVLDGGARCCCSSSTR